MAVSFGRNVKKNTTASSRGKPVAREMPPSVHRSGERQEPPISAAAQRQRAAEERRRREKSSSPNRTNTAVPRSAQGASRQPTRVKSGARQGAQKRNVGKSPAAYAPKAVNNSKIKISWRAPARFDYPFFFVVMILLAFGLVMLFSASYAVAYSKTGDSFYYLKRQAIFAVIGFIAMIALSFFDYRIFKTKFIMIVMVITCVTLMLLVKIVGTTQGGAERWIDLGFMTIQPSEILKFVVIVVLSYYLELRYDSLRDFRGGFVPAGVIVVIACGLVAVQPHLSGTIIVFALCITLLIVGGSRLRHVAVLVGLAICGAVLLLAVMQLMGYQYVDARILSFSDPEADILGDTFQTYQSLLTIGSGGVFGLGLGNSRQKYSYLPVAQNDFIFSIICEELGFVGAIFVILLFIVFVARGYYIAARASDKFGMLVAMGISTQIGLQALLNIAVVSNAIPNTGISLPFFSLGGSALVMQLAEMGIVLNISRRAAID